MSCSQQKYLKFLAKMAKMSKNALGKFFLAFLIVISHKFSGKSDEQFLRKSVTYDRWSRDQKSENSDEQI